MIVAYYYLHENGNIIYKTSEAVDFNGPEKYFESDFVIEWWRISSEDEFINMVNILRVYCDGKKYNVDEQKLIVLERKIGIKTFIEELEAL